MPNLSQSNRRNFLKSSLLGSVTILTGRFSLAQPDVPAGSASRVALMTGEDRVDNVVRGLKPFSGQIAQDIGNRRVVIKPNNVSIDRQLAATHADCIEGILEFLKSIGKASNVVIAESAAAGPAMEGFTNFGYIKVARKFGAKLLDLDTDKTETIHVFDERDFRPHPVRTSKMLLSRDNYIISAAKLKTHDRIVATLSLKNIVFGAPIKDAGFRWGKNGKPGTHTDKPIAHGGGIYGINYNLFVLAHRLRPDLAVIDGYTGMEGNGPTQGDPVEQRVCVVSPDWLAADRVGIELMGIDFSKVGYLNYCAQGKLGQADLSQIEVVGEPLEKHVRHYKLHRKIEQQLMWMNPPSTSSS